jgi:hypothetical protein
MKMAIYTIHATVTEFHEDGGSSSLFTEEYDIQAESEEAALAFFDELHEDRTQDFDCLYFDLPEVIKVRS